MSTALNGTPPITPAEDPLAAHIAGLEAMLPALEAERAQVEAHLTSVVERQRRIRDGIDALQGTRTAAQTAGAKTPKPKQDKRSSHDWVPSQKTVDDIYAALARSDEPMNLTEIADAIHTSRGTVSKGIDELRKQDRVRLCGTAGRGGAKLFTTMPT